jgi:hypothetical protein
VNGIGQSDCDFPFEVSFLMTCIRGHHSAGSFAVGKISNRTWQDNDGDVGNAERDVYYNVDDLDVVHRGNYDFAVGFKDRSFSSVRVSWSDALLSPRHGFRGQSVRAWRKKEKKFPGSFQLLKSMTPPGGSI